MDRLGNPGNDVVYLLGAGASKDAGLLTSAELLHSVTAWAADLDETDTRVAIEALVEAVTAVNPGANIEDLLDAAKELASHSTSPLAHLHGKLREPLRGVAEKAPEVLSGIPGLLMGRIREDLTLPPNADLSYLWDLITLVKSSSIPYLFTLNYDTSLESVLAAHDAKFSTGFIKPLKGNADSSMLPPFEYWPVAYQLSYVGEDITRYTPDMEPADIRVIKLHGSLDWFRIAFNAVIEGGYRISPQDRIIRWPEIPPTECMEIMIAGRTGKERTEEPFRVLLHQFARAIARADVVVVLGYSFSDHHINRILTNAQIFERPRSFDMVVVNGPNWPRAKLSPGAEEAWRILSEAGAQCSRENLYGLEVIPEYARPAIQSGAIGRTVATMLDVRKRGL